MSNETNKFDKMVKGVKVKRLGCYNSPNWESACKANGINIDSVLTISSSNEVCVLFDELTGHKSYKWFKKHFEIVEHAPVEEKENTIKTGSKIEAGSKVKRKPYFVDVSWAGRCADSNRSSYGVFTVDKLEGDRLYIDGVSGFWRSANFELVEEKENTITMHELERGGNRKVDNIKVKRKIGATDFDWIRECNKRGFDYKGEFTVFSVVEDEIYINELKCFVKMKYFELVKEQEPVANSETHNLPEAILKQAAVLAKAYEDYKRELDIHEELVKQLVAKEK